MSIPDTTISEYDGWTTFSSSIPNNQFEPKVKLDLELLNMCDSEREDLPAAAVHKQKPSKDDSVPASKKRKRANKNSDEDVKSKATKKSISGVGGKARNAKAWSEEQDKFVFNLLSDGHGSKKNDVSWKEAREELNNRFPDNPKNLSAIRFRWSTVLQHGSTDLNEEEKKHFFQAINDLEKRDEIMFIMERFKSLSGRTLTKHATKKIYSDVKKGILKQGSDLTSRDEDKDDDSGSDLES